MPFRNIRQAFDNLSASSALPGFNLSRTHLLHRVLQELALEFNKPARRIPKFPVRSVGVHPCFGCLLISLPFANKDVGTSPGDPQSEVWKIRLATILDWRRSGSHDVSPGALTVAKVPC